MWNSSLKSLNKYRCLNTHTWCTPPDVSLPAQLLSVGDEVQNKLHGQRRASVHSVSDSLLFPFSPASPCDPSPSTISCPSLSSVILARLHHSDLGSNRIPECLSLLASLQVLSFSASCQNELSP